MKQIFFDNLPKKNRMYQGYNTEVIDWKNSPCKTVNFIYDEIKGVIFIKSFDKNTNMLVVVYKNKEYPIHRNNFQMGQVGRIIGKTTPDFKVGIGYNIKDKKRNLTIIDREHRLRNRKENFTENQKFYKVICHNCGWDEGWIEESQLVTLKTGCSCCYGRTAVEGINDIPTTAPWMISYFQGGYDEAKLYTRYSDKRIFPICPDCGTIKDKAITVSNIHKNHSIGCYCGDGISYPNKLCYNLLKQCSKQLKYFESEYSPDWAENYRYDFYFEILKNGTTHKYIIEMDGGMGHGNNSDKKKAQESLKIDTYKDKLANSQDIQVIRIDCLKSEIGYIMTNILNSPLNDILNLSVVNWKEVDKLSTTNLVKEVCLLADYVSCIEDLMAYFNLSRSTINLYLRKGKKFGWYNYDVWKNKIKAHDAKVKSDRLCEPIAVLVDNKIVFAFRSLRLFLSKSEEALEYKVSHYMFYKHLKNKTPYNKYTFQHINKEKFNKFKSTSPKSTYGDSFLFC